MREQYEIQAQQQIFPSVWSFLEIVLGKSVGKQRPRNLAHFHFLGDMVGLSSHQRINKRLFGGFQLEKMSSFQRFLQRKKREKKSRWFLGSETGIPYFG